ncbi:MAG: F0F1 ATP synthase subunit delta [Alphaproteobacteria bacterium]|nr:F0F1 ATP synthase subunit delta [Alphaproteobacteria bacterium]
MQFDWWTLALQTVNVLILVWILARFFFRPIAGIVARRREETARLLADAAAERERAEHQAAEAGAERDRIAAERERLLAAAQAEAAAEKERLLARSAEALAHQRAEAEAALKRQRLEAEGSVVAEAARLSVEIAGRLLRRLPPETVFLAFLEGLDHALQGLPESERTALAAADGEHPVEIVTAAPLDEAQADRVRGLLARAAGAPVEPVFRTDPDLVAGLEVHARNTVIRNNWQADLARIREELGHDLNHRGS